MTRSTRFRCVVLSATITAGCCTDRQRDASVPRGRNAIASVSARTATPFPSCRSCAQGRGIVAEIGASPTRAVRLVVNAPAPPCTTPVGAADRQTRVKAARAYGLSIARERRLARTHCSKGHAYPANVTVDKRGARECRACLTASNAAYRARRREKGRAA